VAGEQVAFVNVPETEQHYSSLYVGSDTEAELALRRRHIYSSTYDSQCRAQTNETRYNNSLAWFTLMTQYLTVLKTVRANLSSETIHQLNVLIFQTHGQVSLSVYTREIDQKSQLVDIFGRTLVKGSVPQFGDERDDFCTHAAFQCHLFHDTFESAECVPPG